MNATVKTTKIFSINDIVFFLRLEISRAWLYRGLQLKGVTIIEAATKANKQIKINYSNLTKIMV